MGHHVDDPECAAFDSMYQSIAVVDARFVVVLVRLDRLDSRARRRLPLQ